MDDAITSRERFIAKLAGAWNENRLFHWPAGAEATGAHFQSITPLTRGIKQDGDWSLKSSRIAITVVDYSGCGEFRQELLFLGCAVFLEDSFQTRQHCIDTLVASIPIGIEKVAAFSTGLVPRADHVLVTFLTNLAIGPTDHELDDLLMAMAGSIPGGWHNVKLQFGDGISLGMSE